MGYKMESGERDRRVMTAKSMEQIRIGFGSDYHGLVLRFASLVSNNTIIFEANHDGTLTL